MFKTSRGERNFYTMIYEMGLVGLGAANSLLLIEMERKGLLSDHAILVLEPDTKLANDKTFCFWANPESDMVRQLKDLISHSWNVVETKEGKQSLENTRYYMIESLALYNRTRELIKSRRNISYVRTTLEHIGPHSSFIELTTSENKYQVKKVYDSRALLPKEVIATPVLQSFQGWRVTFDKDVCVPNEMRLMDFSIPQNNATQFMYVLPTTKNEALIEMTRFDRTVLPEELARQHLKNYLRAMGCDYKINHIERGVIPMSQHGENHHRDARVISVGSRAGKIKSTTGYAFKSMFEHAQELVQDQYPPRLARLSFAQKLPNRFALYDFLLLYILKFRPNWGKEIFERLFQKQPAHEVFEFLEERSTFRWEVQMFAKLPIFKFLWSVLFSTISYVFSAPQRSLPLLVGSCVLLLNYFFPGAGNAAGLSVLIVMLFIVGIPHGALDGYIAQGKSKLLPFVLRYLTIMLLVILLWMASPLTGLVTFICYSAWHFGQTDLKEWGLSSTFLSSLWGALLLGVILISHTQEMNTVFLQMNVPILDLAPETVVLVTRGLILVSIILGICLRSVPWLISIIAIMVGTQLSLALSFGLYFVLQHSVTGWNHLKTSQEWTNKSMWVRSLPFTGGAMVLFLLVFHFDKNSLLQWSSYSLVFLSALSLPHIYFMSRFYQKT